MKAILVFVALMGCQDPYRASPREREVAQATCRAAYGRDVQWIAARGYAYCGGKHHVSYDIP